MSRIAWKYLISVNRYRVSKRFRVLLELIVDNVRSFDNDPDHLLFRVCVKENDHFVNAAKHFRTSRMSRFAVAGTVPVSVL